MGEDVEIDINVIVEGMVILGNNVKIGVYCILCNCEIVDNMVIEVNLIIEEVFVGEYCIVGLYVCLCFGVVMYVKVKVGNFVEMKKVVFGEGVKVNYLIYLGDVIVGVNVNIGVGMIICNYDGVNKFKMIIG